MGAAVATKHGETVVNWIAVVVISPFATTNATAAAKKTCTKTALPRSDRDDARRRAASVQCSPSIDTRVQRATSQIANTAVTSSSSGAPPAM